LAQQQVIQKGENMMATINMSKNQKINMTKDDGSAIKNIFIGIAWDMNRYAGEADADLDIHGFPTNADRKIVYPGDLVNFNTYGDGSAYPWCKFSGDNLTGDDAQGMKFNGKHYDEYFIVNADKFPADRSEFIICLTIYRAVQRMQNFGMISNARMMICDYDNPTGDCWEFNMSDDENFENLNAVEVGRLFRSGNGFRFQALGSGYVGGMTELFSNFGLTIDEGRD
jgi:stress response protein SCP2